jgi:H+/gluconate symporter-like permease
MNKKGQTSIMLAVFVAILIFIAGMVLLNFLKQEVTNARTNLSCSSSSNSDGVDMTCLLFDSVVPYFIIIVLAVAGGVITEQVLI